MLSGTIFVNENMVKRYKITLCGGCLQIFAPVLLLLQEFSLYLRETCFVILQRVQAIVRTLAEFMVNSENRLSKN
jgi:hypothetical protein